MNYLQAVFYVEEKAEIYEYSLLYVCTCIEVVQRFIHNGEKGECEAKCSSLCFILSRNQYIPITPAEQLGC